MSTQIKSIKFKNFRSYGNIEQSFELSDDGQVNLICGKNGGGKSTILEVIKFNAYNKSTSNLDELPNFINGGNLCTEIVYKDNNGTYTNVRNYAPKKWEISGDVPDKIADNQKFLESVLKYDYHTFTSFVTLNVDDFKSFLSLSPADKRKIIDKIFNLTIINELKKINTASISETKESISKLKAEIEQTNTSISKLNDTIKQINESDLAEKQTNFNQVLADIEKIKPEYKDLQSKLDELNNKEKVYRDKLYQVERNKVATDTMIREINNKLKLYDNGKCPTCQSDLCTTEHDNIKQNLIDEKNNLSKQIDEFNEYLKTNNEKFNKFIESKRKTEQDFNNLNYQKENLKNKYINLKTEIDKLNNNASENKTIDEIIKTINEFNNTISIKNESITDNDENLRQYKLIEEILSEDGVKSHIFKNIITPMNIYINEILTSINFKYKAVMDEYMDISLYYNDQKIKHGVLSTGQQKRVNFAVLMAYLKITRLRNSINILFLDEIFSSIDVEGIYDMVKILKEFANEYKVNVFIMHHAFINPTFFDRIFFVKNNLFSELHIFNSDELTEELIKQHNLYENEEESKA